MKFLSRIVTKELTLLFACPAILWQIFFLYMPLVILFFYSVIDFSEINNTYHFTLERYTTIFNSLYFRVIINSFVTAVITAFICFLIAYPVAYFLALKASKRYRTFLLISVILPSWTSLIVQIYAWFFMLERNGFFCQFLYRVGILPPSVHLLNNYFAILVGMVSCFLPFMILPIYAVLERMNKILLEASADLGANRFETFKRVIWPLSLPGVYAGLLLVAIPSFGEFAIPTLLGGAKSVFWGNLIVDKFLRSRDWASGAALANIGILLPGLVIFFFYCMMRIRAIIKNSDKLGVNKEPW